MPTFPTETEIYILPTGEVIIADLPAELQPMTIKLAPESDGANDSVNDALPTELAAVLAADAEAQRIFAAMPPSHKRETVRYIEEAKKPETRSRRAAQTIQWLRDGKIGNKSSR